MGQNKLDQMQKQIELNSKLISLSNDIDNSLALWKKNVTVPFCQCYCAAYDRYMEQLNIRKLTREQNAEMAMLAISLCGGCAITAVLGKVSLGLALKNQALKIVCDRNMNKTFRAMAIMEASPVAQFLLGQAENKLKTWASSEIKTALSKVNNSGVSLTRIDTPAQLGFAFEGLYANAENVARTAFKYIIYCKKSTEEKEELIKVILNSPFCNPPTAVIWPNQDLLVERIELSFYLKLVLDSDYISSIYGGGPRTPINVLPSSANYPRKVFPAMSKNLGYKVMMGVGFADIGDNIAKRINELYRKLNVVDPRGNNENLVHDYPGLNNTDYKGIKKVEQVLEKLGNLSTDNVRRQTDPRKKC